MLKEYFKEKYDEEKSLAFPFVKREIKSRIAGINYLSNILNAMSKYDGKDKKVLNEIKAWSHFSHLNDDTMPLPSGRVGGALAVALEMHKYLIALEILNNPEQYYANLDVVSHIEGGKPWSAEETFDFSLLSFDEKTYRNFAKEEECKKQYSPEQIAEMIKKEEANVAAAEEIASRFSKKATRNFPEAPLENLGEFRTYLSEHYDDAEIDDMLKKGLFK